MLELRTGIATDEGFRNVDQGDRMAREIRDDRQGLEQELDDRLDRLDDVAHGVEHGPEEVLDEASAVEVDLVEVDIRVTAELELARRGIGVHEIPVDHELRFERR